MLREIVHFVRHVPGVARLSLKMDQAELFHLLSKRADEAGLFQWRERLVHDLKGRVLEIGCGTGLMFPHYTEAAEVIGTEPERRFLALAEARENITLEVADAQDLPYDDQSFDAVVVGGVLCSVPDVGRALAELRRVLKPTGELRLIEHVKSPRPLAGLLMELFNPLWRAYNRQGCNMNRRTERALERAGFELTEVEPFQIYSDGLPAFPSRYLRACPVTEPRHGAAGTP